MDKKSSTTQTATQTSSTEPFTGTTKAWAESLYPQLSSGLNTGTSTIADAFNKNTYGVGTNSLQASNYNRAQNLLNNSTLQNMASGSLIGTTDMSTQLAPQISQYNKAFATSLDSLRSGSQRSGMANSSTRRNAENSLAETAQTGLSDMITSAYTKQRQQDISDMTAANSILASAGTVGDTYQQSQQASKDASVNNALKAESLDSNTISQLLAYLQMMKNGTTTGTTSGTSSTTQNNGIGGLFGM